ncbi:MAG: hypothetical protein EPO40_02625 [Myxococcaceae bacterium]|nr:MAG: hypothetical protein EPO40_02625 [Myxococcaceae bacterium]
MSRRADRSCPYDGEVEAAHDGRLGAFDLARLDRHLVTCASCRALRAGLAALRAEASRAAELPLDRLSQQRARAAILQRAARPGPAHAFAWARLASSLAALAAVVLGVGALRRPHGPHAAPPHPLARVDAAQGASWSREASASAESIRLADGVIRVTVPHQHRGHRFLVLLPDGQIEVRGTRFEVEVRDRHTTRLDVTEGLVALRLGARTEQLLAAGSHWALAPSTADLAPVLAPVLAPAPEQDPSARPARVHARRTAPAHAPAMTSELSSFVAGLDAFQRGDLAIAADDFAAFEREHPTDDRAEDAGYLRVVALRRAGTTLVACAAAESYLRRYPAGARRWETIAYLAHVGGSRLACEQLDALDVEFGRDPARYATLRALRDGCRP